MKKIAIIVAMQSELMPFLKSAGKFCREEESGIYKVKVYECYGKELYILSPGIGEIHATAGTQFLITKYNVDLVFNFGVVGALTDDLNVTDVVAVNGAVHYDFDLSPIDPVKPGEYEQFGGALIKTDDSLLNLVKDISPSIKLVNCASGDKFIADEDYKQKLASQFDCQICDMESVGMLITCKNNNVPFLSIKAVSDGKGGAEEFKAMLTRATTAYISLLEKIIPIL